MERSLRHQVGLTILVAVSAGLALIPIEMQRRLVNEASGTGNLTALMRYGIALLVGALSVTTAKFAINLYQGYIAEHVLRDFRARRRDRIVERSVDHLERTPPA